MRAVAITGPGGMIGRHLVDVLRRFDVTIKALLLPNEAVPPSFGGDVEVQRGDIRDPAVVKGLIEGADTVFHLAALVGRDANRAALDLARAVNVGGTGNVIDAARRAGVARLVHLSTCCVYGLYGPRAETIDETAPHVPLAMPYDLTKTEAEALVRSIDPADVPWTVLQIPVALGGEHTVDKPAILSFVKLVKLHLQPRPLTGTLWTNYVFGSDVADALVALAQHENSAGEAFIHSESAPMPDLLRWIATEMNQSLVPVPLPSFAFDFAASRSSGAAILGNRRRFSAAKIGDRIGFRPAVGMKAGVRRTVRHYMSGGFVP